MVRRILAVTLTWVLAANATVRAETPKKGKDKETGPQIAHIKLSGDLDEAPSMPDPIFGGASGESLKTKLERIAKAKKDDNVKALYLEFGGLDIGFAKVDEMRRAIADFRSTGKKVFCYAENYNSRDYLVALACDVIGAPESGGVELPGIRAEIMFYKDFFEKVKLQADFLQMGDFKGAAEPYMRNGMSPEFRKQYETVIDDFFEKSYVETIVKSRPEKKRSIEDARKIVDQGMFTTKQAEAAGLIDRKAYPDEFITMMKDDIKESGALKVAKNYGTVKGEEVDLSNPFAILKLLSPPKPKVSKEPKVAVIYAVGAIESGKGGANPFTGATIGSTTMVEAIQQADKDETVKAIVLRVDSPGGSALASDLIWNALISCKKPVVASMGDVAASGGYYISMGCRKIFAEPGTLTGSIGVVGGKIVTGGLFNWAGLKTEVISRGANSGVMSSDQLWNEAERKVIRESMQDVYDMFLDKSLAGRRRAGVLMNRDKLLTLAGGRIWTGRQAKANGLVDELGTLEDAIAAAKKMAGVDGKDMEILTLPKPRSFLDRFAEGGIEARLAVQSELLKILPQAPKSVRHLGSLMANAKERIWLIPPAGIEIK